MGLNLRVVTCVFALLACAPEPDRGPQAPSTRSSSAPPAASPAPLSAAPPSAEGPLPSATPPNVETPAAPPPTPTGLDAGSWNRAFAAHLEHQFTQPNNMVLSPASLQTVLAMTWAGSRGRTSEEMALALQIGVPQAQAHPKLGKLVSSWKSKPGAYTLNLTNRTFVQNDYRLEPTFLNLLHRHYAAGSEQVDFSGAPEPARQRINSWVQEATAQEIKSLLPPGSIGRDSRLVLVNTAYFKGTWVNGFDQKKTLPEAFQLATGEFVQVPTMHAKVTVRTAMRQELDARALELDYQGDRFSMVLLMPNKPNGLSQLEQGISEASLKALFQDLRPRELQVSLPRFSIDSGVIRLKLELERMGMVTPFTSNADFSGMTGKPGLWIDDVYHRARVQVDEAGTVAAAASAVVMGKSAGPMPFQLNRPFVFLIRDKQDDAVLFIGRVADPRI